jgi:hypothetical protein
MLKLKEQLGALVPEIVETEVGMIRSRFVSDQQRLELISADQLAKAVEIAKAETVNSLLELLSKLPAFWQWERTDSILWLPALTNVISACTVNNRKYLSNLLYGLEFLLIDPIAETAWIVWEPIAELYQQLLEISDFENAYRCVRVLRKFAARRSFSNKLSRLSLVKGDHNPLGDSLGIPYAVPDLTPSAKDWLARLVSNPQALSDKIRDIAANALFGLESLDESTFGLKSFFSQERGNIVVGENQLSLLPDTLFGAALKRVLSSGQGNRESVEWAVACRLVALDVAFLINPKTFNQQLTVYPGLLGDVVFAGSSLELPETPAIFTAESAVTLAALELLARLAKDTSHSDFVTSQLPTLALRTKISLEQNHSYMYPLLEVFASRAVAFQGLQSPLVASAFLPWIPPALEYISRCPSDDLVFRHSTLSLLRLTSLTIEKGGGAQVVRFMLEKEGFEITKKRMEGDIAFVESRATIASDPITIATVISVRANLRLVEIAIESLGGTNSALRDEFLPSIARILSEPDLMTEGTVAVAGAALGSFISRDPAVVSHLVKAGIVEKFVVACSSPEALSTSESVATLAQCVEAISLHEEGEKELARLGNPLFLSLIPKFIQESADQLSLIDPASSDWNAAEVMGQTLDELIRNRPNTQRDNVLNCLLLSVRERRSCSIDGLNEVCRVIQTMAMNGSTAAWFVENGMFDAVLKLGSECRTNFTHATPSHGICKLIKTVAQLSSQLHLSGGVAISSGIHSWPRAAADLVSEVLNSKLPNVQTVDDFLEIMSPVHLALHTCALAIKDVPPASNPTAVEQFNRILNELALPRFDPGLVALTGKGSSVSVLGVVAGLAFRFAGSSTDPKIKAEDEKELRRRLRDDRRFDEQIFTVHGDVETNVIEHVKGLWMAVRGFMCQVARVVNYPSVPRTARQTRNSSLSKVTPQVVEAGRLLGLLAVDCLSLASSENWTIASSESVDLMCRLHVEDKHHMTRPLCVMFFYKLGGVDLLIEILVKAATARDNPETVQSVLWWFERTTSMKRMHNAQLTFLLHQVESLGFNSVALVASLQYEFAKGFLPCWRNDECLFGLTSKAAASLLKALTHVLEPHETVLSSLGAVEPTVIRNEELSSDIPQPTGLISKLITGIGGFLGVEPSPSSPVVVSPPQVEKPYVNFSDVVLVAKDSARDFMERALVLGSSENTGTVAAQTHLADVCVRLSHNGVLKLGPVNDEEIVFKLAEAMESGEDGSGGRWRAGTVTFSAEELQDMNEVETRVRIDGIRGSGGDLASVETEAITTTVPEEEPTTAAENQVVFSTYNARHIAKVCFDATVDGNRPERVRQIASTVLACTLHARGSIVKDIISIYSLIELLRGDVGSWLTSVLVCLEKLKVGSLDPVGVFETTARLLKARKPNLTDKGECEGILRVMAQAATAAVQQGLSVDSFFKQYEILENLLTLPESAAFEGMQTSCLNALVGAYPAGSASETVVSSVVRYSILSELFKHSRIDSEQLVERVRQDCANRGITAIDLSAVIKLTLQSIPGIVRGPEIARSGKRQKTGGASESVLIELLEPLTAEPLLDLPTEVPAILAERLILLAEAFISRLRAGKSDVQFMLSPADILLGIENLCKTASVSYLGVNEEIRPLPRTMCEGAITLLANLISSSKESPTKLLETNKLVDIFIFRILKSFALQESVGESLQKFLRAEPVSFGSLVLCHKFLQSGQSAPIGLKGLLLEAIPNHQGVELEGLIECLELSTRPPLKDKIKESSPVVRQQPAQQGEVLHRLVEALQDGGAQVLSASMETDGDSGIVSVGIVPPPEVPEEGDLMGSLEEESDNIVSANNATADSVRNAVRRILSPLVASDVAVQFPRFYTNRRRPQNALNAEVTNPEDFLNPQPTASAMFAQVVGEPQYPFDLTAGREHPLISRSHTGASHPAPPAEPEEPRTLITDLNDWMIENLQPMDSTGGPIVEDEPMNDMSEESSGDDEFDEEDDYEDEDRRLLEEALREEVAVSTATDFQIPALTEAARRYGMSEQQIVAATGIDPAVLRDLPEHMHGEIIREQMAGLMPVRVRRSQPLAPRPTLNAGAGFAQLMGQLEWLTSNAENILRPTRARQPAGGMADGFLIIDSTGGGMNTGFPPLPVSSNPGLGGPRISASTVDAVCELYDASGSESPLPVSAVRTLVSLVWKLRGSKSGILALENLLFNLALHRETRKAVLEELMALGEAIAQQSPETLTLCTQIRSENSPVRVVIESMLGLVMNVLGFVVSHIPLSFDTLAQTKSVDRLVGMLPVNAEAVLAVLHVLLVPEISGPGIPQTRRHRQRGHSDSKVDKLQRSLSSEPLILLVHVGLKSSQGMEVIRALLETEMHAIALIGGLGGHLRVLAGELRQILDNGQNVSEKTASQLKEILKLLTDVRSPNLEVEDRKDRLVADSEDLKSLWRALDRAVAVLEEPKPFIPLIEAFFLAHTEIESEGLLPRSASSRVATPVSVSDLTWKSSRLLRFVEVHRKTLNLMIREEPELLSGSFQVIIKRCPWAVEFDNKRTYFREKLRQSSSPTDRPTIKLNVRRSEVFMDSFYQLRHRSSSEMKGKLSVQFTGEEGVDAGGLVREWFGILAREIFNPNYALFRTAGGKASTFHPNPMSFVNPDHLSFFEFCGRVMGKALYDDQRLDAYFTRSFYKRMLNAPVTWMDFEVEDPDYYKQLQWILNTDLTTAEASAVAEHLSFTVDVEEFGVVRSEELIRGGSEIPVTEQNKKEYVKLVCEYKMTTSTAPQVTAFLKGFHELIPADLLGSLFDDKELELSISGLPSIDLADLRANTEYVNYSASAPQIQWLWKVLETEFSQEQLAWFLQFVTGSAQVPLEGFKALTGMRGPQKFSIHKAYGGERLPTAHTCFNQLDLPEYERVEILRDKLIKAVTEAHEGFGFI